MSISPTTPRKRRRTAFRGNYADLAGQNSDGTDVDMKVDEDEDEDEEGVNEDSEDQDDNDDELRLGSPSKGDKSNDTIRRRRVGSHVLATTTTPRRGRYNANGASPIRRSDTDLDRSARRRAATRLLVDRILGDDIVYGESPVGDLDDEDRRIAEQIILESRRPAALTGIQEKKSTSGIEDDASDMGDELIAQLIPETFGDEEESATAGGLQGALFLEGAEGYFDQHKLREKISKTPFSKAPRIEYQDFVDFVSRSLSIHEDSRSYLSSLYKTMFPQWKFELMQGFSLLFYGVGSKRDLIMEFVSKTIDQNLPVLVANGYNPATNFKEILNSAVSVLVKDESIRSAMPKQPSDLVDALLSYLENNMVEEQLVLVVHNIDGEGLRSDRWQALLGRLCSAKQIWLVASVDHINAPILWDAAKLSQYNFLWHDLTTFELYTTETSFEDPLALGRDRSAVGSRGAKFVLSSLTANARKLYQELICHQIAVMSDILPADDTSTVGSHIHGIEFKLLYKQCVEQFIVSNELNFRTMLTEFLDHKMAARSQDQTGLEVIYVPFTKDAIESILEELMELDMKV